MEQKTVKQQNSRDQDQDKVAENAGDDRTPEKAIGQIAYADKRNQTPDKGSGGAGEPQATPTEPEKQGGIGGP